MPSEIEVQEICSPITGPLGFDAATFRFFARDEVIAVQGDFGFCLVFWSPGTKTIAEPGHARFELWKAEFFPNFFRPLHELFSG